MGQLLATLPTCAHLSPDSQARLHRAGSVPCKPKTLKMSAYGTFSPTARPPRVLPTPWALPTPAFATWRGCGEKPPAPLPQSVGSPPTCKKAKPLRGCFASLDGFPAPSASVSFATPRRWRGVRNRPNTHRRGRWIGLPPAPAASQVSVGFGAKPQACFLFFEVVRVDVTVQKVKKMCILESLLLKTPQIWPISDPPPPR